jgi:hypothetical protein
VSAESTVLQGRAFNERLMTSTCRVERSGGEPVFDDVTGEYVPSASVIYEGACKVRFISAVVGEVNSESQLLVEQDAILSLPIEGSELVKPDDVATITASRLDAALLGKKFRVKGGHAQTSATARRLPVELTT